MNKLTFSTKDLYLAAFIWCQSTAKFTGISGKQGKGCTVFFDFELELTDAEMLKLQLSYANGETLVEPLKYSKQLNKLRDFIHGGLGIKDKKNG